VFDRLQKLSLEQLPVTDNSLAVSAEFETDYSQML
jgi:hypothetical protein